MKKNIMFRRSGAWRKIMCMLCILSVYTLTAFAQQRVSGTVTDATGEPVIGANIMEKGVTANGTVTDVDGKFTLSVKSGATLTVSYIGYVTQEIAVGNRSELKITLTEDSRALDEVVVVGYGTQKKINLSGAVNTINSQAIENRQVSNINTALQGLAPNLNIKQSTGALGATPDINVRGVTSINGGSAFILVDNVPVSADELGRLNPADIENVSVLKDAASSAIYGARAAFGVLLITTKSAKSEKLQVSADLTYGSRRETFKYEPDLDLITFFETINATSSNPNWATPEELAYARQVMADPSLPIAVTGLQSPDEYSYFAVMDWRKLMMRESMSTWTANVNISQKTDRLSYILSGGYYAQEGLIKSEKPWERFNLRGKGEYSLTPWWKAGATISFNHIRTDGPQDVNYWRIITEYIHEPVHNPDGSYTERGGSQTYAPVMDGGRNVSKINETQLSFNTELNLVKDVLALKADLTFKFTDGKRHSWRRGFDYRLGPNLPLRTAAPPDATNSHDVNTYTVTNLYGDFHKTFADKHFVQALAGFNQEYLYASYDYVSRRGIITSSLPSIQLANGDITTGETINTLALRGMFGRLNYIFDRKYILELNGRYDGTSRYPSQNRFGFFPSGSLAWAVSQEGFFESVKEALSVDMFKLRGSYGVLGNQAYGGYYPYLATMGAGYISSILENAQPMAIYQPGVSPVNLTWETVRTVNGGVDLALFNNRFDISFDKYTRYTEGMITKSKTLPGIYGASEPRQNAADLKTKGWELTLGYRDRLTVAGDPLEFNLRLMIADSRAWITKYDNPAKLLATHGRGSDWYEGQEVGEIWGFDVLGFFTSAEDVANSPDQTKVGSDDEQYKWYAGDVKFKDRNGDGEITFGSSVDDPGDRHIIGNSQTRLPYSGDLNAGWKGFDLRIFLQGVGKRDYYVSSSRGFWSSYTSPWIATSTHIRDRWTPENPNGYFPRLKRYIAEADYTGELNTPNTRYMQDASYLRLKNLVVGYTLPASITRKWHIDRLRFYVSGENLWTLSHVHAPVDPETIDDTLIYPLQKIFSLGLNLNF